MFQAEEQAKRAKSVEKIESKAVDRDPTQVCLQFLILTSGKFSLRLSILGYAELQVIPDYAVKPSPPSPSNRPFTEPPFSITSYTARGLPQLINLNINEETNIVVLNRT